MACDEIVAKIWQQRIEEEFDDLTFRTRGPPWWPPDYWCKIWEWDNDQCMGGAWKTQEEFAKDRPRMVSDQG